MWGPNWVANTPPGPSWSPRTPKIPLPLFSCGDKGKKGQVGTQLGGQPPSRTQLATQDSKNSYSFFISVGSRKKGGHVGTQLGGQHPSRIQLVTQDSKRERTTCPLRVLRVGPRMFHVIFKNGYAEMPGVFVFVGSLVSSSSKKSYFQGLGETPKVTF